MKSWRTSAVLHLADTEADVPVGEIDRGKDPFDILTQSVELECIYGPRTEDTGARDRIDELWAELWAICVWDRHDSLWHTQDEIDRMAWQARRMRLKEIKTELDRLRTEPSHCSTCRS